MPSRSLVSPQDNWERVFSGAAGLWLALALIKFGNPVILERQIEVPTTRDEFVLHPWPMAWGYALFACFVVLGLRFWRWRTDLPRWLLVLPLAWLGWQALSALQTIEPALTGSTLKHFVVCVLAFYLGLFAFSRVTALRPFWIGLLGGFLAVLLVGWRQHFGGLAETRRYFFSLPDWQSYPREFVEKVSSDRIYSTLFYPNALAGVIILLLPVSVLLLWERIFPNKSLRPEPLNRLTRPSGTLSPSEGERDGVRGWSIGRRFRESGRLWPMAARLAGVGAFGLLGLGCLYWSGSKAGWLLALVQGIAAVLLLPLERKIKVWVVVGLLLTGLAGFWSKYQGYFERGATSVSARFDYWRAAWQTLQRKPLLGAGPGTFMVSYKELKLPEAEMSRLAHNDFLEQGSDSGWVGLLTYLAWVAGSLGLLYRRTVGQAGERLGLWLGLGGVTLQGLVEFGLYVPALSWTTYFLLGWSLGRSQPSH